nr:lytic transglycosylase domain-containing protein [Biomaibacter acetigenes]
MAKKIAAVLIVIIGLLALYNNISWFIRYLYPLKYQDYIVKYSQEYQMDPYMVAAVIKVESGFSPNVVSSKGAVGLMQIMPETATWAAEKNGHEGF